MSDNIHIAELKKVMGKTRLSWEEGQNIIEIINQENSIFKIGALCFAYGKMAGKQEERRRRKKEERRRRKKEERPVLLQDIIAKLERNEDLILTTYSFLKHAPERKITAPGCNPEAVKKDGRPSQSNLSLPSLPEKSKEGQG